MAAGQNVEEPPVKLTKCGDFKTENPTLGTLAADKEKIFLGTADGNLQAFDQNLLSPAWHTELGGGIVSNITVYDGGVLVVSNVSKAAEAPAESVLRSISKETGVPNWTAKLPYSEHFFLGVTGPSITAIAIDGRIANIDLKTGHIRWQNTGSGRITARPFFSEKEAGFGTAEKQIVVKAVETGETLLKLATEFTPTAVGSANENSLAFGDERGNVALVGISGGKTVWKFKSGAAVSFVSPKNEGLLVTSLDNFVYFVSMYNGDVIWKRRLPGRVADASLVLGGMVATLVYGENSVFIINLKNGVIADRFQSSGGNFINQRPVEAGDSELLLIDTDGVALYALAGCDQKTGKAAKAPPFK